MPARIVVKPATTGHPPRSRRGDLVLLRQGVDIALEYFNSDDPAKISTLTTRARKWADRYFRGYRYASKRPTALLGTFPNLFNLRVQGKQASAVAGRVYCGWKLTKRNPQDTFGSHQRRCPRRLVRRSPRAPAPGSSGALSGRQ